MWRPRALLREIHGRQHCLRWETPTTARLWDDNSRDDDSTPARTGMPSEKPDPSRFSRGPRDAWLVIRLPPASQNGSMANVCARPKAPTATPNPTPSVAKRRAQANPKISQRDLAKGIGMSLGRTNDIQRKRLEYDALQAQLEQITAEAQAAGLIDS